MSLSKTIVLKSSDGETFEVDETVALESQTIKHMIEDNCADTSIPLPNVTSKILAKVIEYCKKHVDTRKSEDKTAEDDLKTFDAAFVKVDQGTLFDLILAANYLNIKSLLDLTCQTVADMIKGKTPKKICKILNIKIDFTPEDEEFRLFEELSREEGLRWFRFRREEGLCWFRFRREEGLRRLRRFCRFRWFRFHREGGRRRFRREAGKEGVAGFAGRINDGRRI